MGKQEQTTYREGQKHVRPTVGGEEIECQRIEDEWKGKYKGPSFGICALRNGIEKRTD